MMVKWRSKHVGANKLEKKYILLVHLLVFSLTVYDNARYGTHKKYIMYLNTSYIFPYINKYIYVHIRTYVSYIYRRTFIVQAYILTYKHAHTKNNHTSEE